VIVVDPKVGTNRKILCVKTNEAYYLAPDNGVLSFILENEKPFTIRSIENQAFMRDEVSFTFHGRDKFAPVAAHLSKSDIFEKVGPKISTFETLEWPKPHFKTDHVEGEVIHVDRFGNLMTNLRAKEIEKKFKPEEVSIGRLKITKWVNSYGEGRDRELVVLINSAGFIEIAATNDSAAALSSANVGSKVTCV
jgi:S-adenosylmethionine hydrolase